MSFLGKVIQKIAHAQREALERKTKKHNDILEGFWDKFSNQVEWTKLLPFWHSGNRRVIIQDKISWITTIRTSYLWIFKKGIIFIILLAFIYYYLLTSWLTLEDIGKLYSLISRNNNYLIIIWIMWLVILFTIFYRIFNLFTRKDHIVRYPYYWT